MSEVICTSCGKTHTAEGKYCEFCGTDLAYEILKNKENELPIKYEKSVSSERQFEQKKTYGCLGTFALFFCQGDCPSREVRQEQKRILKEKPRLRNCGIATLVTLVLIVIGCFLILFYSMG